jgi:hypothetical protein
MENDPTLPDFVAERARMSRVTRKGIGMPIAESRGYPFLTVSLALVTCVGALVTGGPMTTLVPLLAAGCYAVAVGVLWTEVRAL